MKEYSVAVAGVTGSAGRQIVRLLEERSFPLKSLTLLDHAERVGEKLTYKEKEYEAKEIADFDFSGCDIAFFEISDSLSSEFAPKAAAAGCTVIDNSTFFRHDEDVPLVVPEVNPEALLKHKGIISIPNCTTVIAMTALKPIHDAAKITRLIVSTYQAASGAGLRGMAELNEQASSVLAGEEAKHSAFAHRLAFNLIPHIDDFEEEDYTLEELKLIRETKKILNAPDMKINCTCVRVPVERAHSESVTIETEKPITPDEARALLAKAPGVVLQDDPENLVYPMPMERSGHGEIAVGRIRRDLSGDGLCLWICGDQILKGSALNAVQIAEKLIELDVVPPVRG